MNSEIALQNLKFIKENNNLTENNYVITHNRIFQNTDENFDQVYSLKEMEYMIYFTFSECFYLIEIYSNCRKNIIRDLYEIYDTLEVFYENTEEKDEIFEDMMDKFDEKLEYYHSRYVMGLCNYYSELFSNKIYDILYDCANEVFYKKELFLDPFCDESDYDDSESKNVETEDSTDVDNEKKDN
tara:strand:+ start:90 stop:641 length:552 start_codon:yes stop_codon:yes gene_type:complete